MALERFPQGLTLEQERARAIECKYCHMLVFWNTRCIFRRTVRPMLVDAINGGPKYNQNHNCAFREREMKEYKYLQESLDNFITSVRPETALAIIGENVNPDNKS